MTQIVNALRAESIDTIKEGNHIELMSEMPDVCGSYHNGSAFCY